MHGPPPETRSVRPPAVAGTFYPADAGACLGLVRQFFDAAAADNAAATTAGADRRWIGGLVPHAGWICSGAIAAETIAATAAAMASAKPPDVVVVFGAVHAPGDVDFAALDAHARWAVPGGESEVAADLGDALVGGRAAGLFAVEPRLHAREHAIEVELPLVRHAWPGVTILPVEVPPIDAAADIGRATAAAIRAAGRTAAYLASSDLTHYGPAYRFAPGGVGPGGLRWAKANDRRLLDAVEAFAVERIVGETRAHANACGGGAIAAMMAACQAEGATAARVLRHASSFETLADVHPQPPTNAVGYAAVVVG